jgi:hypothetical protein
MNILLNSLIRLFDRFGHSVFKSKYRGYVEIITEKTKNRFNKEAK